MNRWDTVAIIGVGLIGGSIGLALRQRKLARRVVGIGRRTSSLRAAKRCGAVTSTTIQATRGVRDADLTIVCTPVGSIVDQVQLAAQSCPRGALITDAGSTKSSIVQALDGVLSRDVRFVGSHPLAGSEKTGPLSAQPDLFEDRVVVITPSRRTSDESVLEIERFWRSLGARVVQMPARQHDAAVATISHLPHLVASALAAATSDKQRTLAAAGWLDTTRVAAGDSQLWQQILSDNRSHVLKSLDKFEELLSKFRTALQDDDAARLKKLLEAGRQNRDAVGS